MSDRIFASIADYRAAYGAGRSTPVQVARRLLEAVSSSERMEPPMRIFINQSEADLMEQAEQSTRRLQRGEPRGPLEGVPIAVKDEIDQAGYPTTVGTSFLGQQGPVPADATAVARLRAAGALLIGKTNMHEVGLGVTGINPHHGAARNPYAPGHVTGGSSSGSAAAVAAGLCPVAIGADGGGSVRIPAALCGVAGIKPTFGRISEHGAAPVVWSLAHIGPLAAWLGDAAEVLQLMAGVDEKDPSTFGQPALELDGRRPLAGLRVGWPSAWVEQAAPAVRELCRSALQGLVQQGALVHELRLDHLDLHRLVQYVTIGVEIATSQYEHRRAHLRDYGADTRLLLEIASQVPAVDYLRAQRLRSQIRAAFERAHQEVDLIATPTTAATAPAIRPGAETHGESDDEILENLTAFSFAANLTGQPALTVPVGYQDGFPIGLQLTAAWWREAVMIRAGLALEQRLERRAPKVHYQLLDRG